MNVGIGTEAAQFHSLGIVVSNFRYTVFAVWSVSSSRELDQHGVLPSLAGEKSPDRCDLHCDGRTFKFAFYTVLRPAPVKFCFVFLNITYVHLSHLSDILHAMPMSPLSLSISIVS
jgi:hypothetical protein